MALYDVTVDPNAISGNSLAPITFGNVTFAAPSAGGSVASDGGTATSSSTSTSILVYLLIGVVAFFALKGGRHG